MYSSHGPQLTIIRKVKGRDGIGSDRDGVLTWVLAPEGALLHRGDVIARIADLTSYRVSAAVSDVHAAQLRTGMPVIVKANDVDLAGAIAEVLPTVNSGTISFNVALNERSHVVLMPSLRVDVLVVTDRKPRTLRIKRGPFADGSPQGDGYSAFIVRGNRAVRTAIALGLTAFDEWRSRQASRRRRGHDFRA
jgi:HlyD family secretion protein